MPAIQAVHFLAITCAHLAVGVSTDDAGSHKREVEIGPRSVHVQRPTGRKHTEAALSIASGTLLEAREQEAAAIVRREGSEKRSVGIAADGAEARSEESEMKQQQEAGPSEVQMLFHQQQDGAQRRYASQDGAAPYFVAHWNGHRNNWYGDVGIAFVPVKDFTIVSLGRHNNTDYYMHETVPVTLWSAETQQSLATVRVGPNSFQEGHYLFEPIDAPGVTVSQGKEYRLSQACTPGMRDKWFDMDVTQQDLLANSATSYARFVGAVNQSGFGYPVNSDGQFRRAGMVNFKMAPAPTNHVYAGAPPGAGLHGVIIGLCSLLMSRFLMT